MQILLRIIGYFFMALSAFLLIMEIFIIIGGHGIGQPLGQAWYDINSGSLNLTQAIVQRYLFPWIWDIIFIPLLTLATWKSLTALILLSFVIGSLALKKGQRGKTFY